MEQQQLEFRAWDKDRKIFHYSGFVIKADGGRRPFSYIEDNLPEMPWEDVQQFTGLKDKTGRKIFEGDIVVMKIQDEDTSYGDDGEESIIPARYMRGEIKFNLDKNNSNVAGWILKEEFGLHDHLLFPKFEKEVIGNIFEHPELIK